jgi:DNA segregation ATPase FtsK/SpoIIIE-like protein
VDEILEALGARDPLWKREWTAEKELRSNGRDHREVARALEQIARMGDVVLHVRSTGNGRFLLLGKADSRSSFSRTRDTCASEPRTHEAGAAEDTRVGNDGGATAQKPEVKALPAPLMRRPAGPPQLGRQKSPPTAGPDEPARALRRAIEEIGVAVEHVDPVPLVGPSVTRYRVRLAAGERFRQLRRRAEDLARELGNEVFVSQVPGDRYVAIDLPRKDRQVVPLTSALKLFPSSDDPAALWFPVGVTPAGEPVFLDLTLLPHVLLAGGTGSGKSVWLRSFLLGLMLRLPSSALEVLLIDPKAVDYSALARAPHLRARHIITEPDEAIEHLRDLCGPELARRTQLLQEARCSNFRELRGRQPEIAAPYFVAVIDEFADLGLALDKAARAEFERHVLRLVQRGRAAGIFLVLATQRPSVEFVTGAVKANLPTRISFRLPQRVDSQVILDEPGAEDLLGAGDLLLLHDARLQRLQGYFASTEDAAQLLEGRLRDFAPGPSRA